MQNLTIEELFNTSNAAIQTLSNDEIRNIIMQEYMTDMFKVISFFILFTLIISYYFEWYYNRKIITITEKYNDMETLANILSDDDVHNLLAYLTKRMIILNWYTKEDIVELKNEHIDEAIWENMLKNQDDIAAKGDLLMIDWINSDSKTTTNDEPATLSDEPTTIEDVLRTLTNNQLKLFAGVTSNYSKEELVDMIMNHFKENADKVIDKKIERLEKMLS